ncbi:MAG TPA: glycosyltransferase family 39 protein [Ktedonobacterales bacterium]
MYPGTPDTYVDVAGLSRNRGGPEDSAGQKRSAAGRPSLTMRAHVVWSDIKLGLRVTPLLTYVDWVIALALALTTLGLGMYQTDSVSLWYDETWSYGVATVPIVDMLRYFFHWPNMMSYHIFLHFWLGLSHLLHTEPDELYLRLPSAIAIALSVAVLYLFGRHFFGHVAGLVAALAYMLNSIVLQDAQQVRAYAPELLLAIVSWYALAVALETSEQSHYRARRWWMAYSVITILAIYTHLFMVLILGSQVLAVLFLAIVPGPWHARALIAWRAFWRSCVAIVVCSIPILILAKLGGTPNTWVPVPGPKDIYALLMILSGGDVTLLVLSVSLGLIAFGLLVAALAKTSLMHWLDDWKLRMGLRQKAEEARALDLAPIRAPHPGVSLIVIWAAGTILLSYIVSQKFIGQHFFYYRYENVVIPALCLLIGVGVSALRWRIAQAGVAIALLILLAQGPGYYYRHAQVQDFRTPALWLKAHYQPGDGIACTDSTSCSIPMGYYLEAYPPSAAQFDSDSPGAFFWAAHHGVASSIDGLSAYSAKHHRVFLVVFRGTQSSEISPEGQAMKAWYDTHFPLVGSAQTTTESVYLYDTASPRSP